MKLSEHNEEMGERRREAEKKAHLAGVECDKCETEMHLRNPGWANASYPPSQWVICPNCGHTGLKYGM